MLRFFFCLTYTCLPHVGLSFHSIQEGRSSVARLKTIYHKKMKPKQEGPFRITEVLGPLTYRLQLPTSWGIHNVFHATLLKPYRENETYGQNFPEPPPELVEGEEVYEIETILNHRKRGRGYQYYVKWQGYPISVMGTGACVLR